jgi:hypothetical protein
LGDLFGLTSSAHQVRGLGPAVEQEGRAEG